MSYIMEMEEEIFDPALAEQQQPPEKKLRIDANDESSNQQSAVKSIVANLLDEIMAKEEESDNDAPSDSNSLPMKIQLPLETWVDVLAYVPRPQLVETVGQIHNRQFSKILQFFLHKCGGGEITLGNMEIFDPRKNVDDANDEGCRPVVIVQPVMNNRGKWWRETTLADGPPPKNVKDFTSIHLSYLDKSVLNFLRELQHHDDSQLLANVNFSISIGSTKENNLLKILANLLPLISSFNSIHLWIHHLNQINDAAGNNNDVGQLAIKMLAQARCLEVCYHSFVLTYEIDWFCNWLYSPRDALEPRVLHIHKYSNYWAWDMQKIHPLIDRIKKDFSMAKQPVRFFILIVMRRSFHLEHASLANDKTRERLVVKKASNAKGMLISRYPLEAANKWEEAEKEAEHWRFGNQRRRIIRLESGLKMAL